jgi:glucokinase
MIKGQYILTADIGGSHITAAVYNSTTHAVVKDSVTRVELRSKGSAESIFTAWTLAFADTLKKAQLPVVGLGIAMPGPFDYEKGISYIKGLNKYEALYGLNIKEHLAALLDIKPDHIRFRNDAEATIAGEALAGAGIGFDHIVGVTLGTGFGSAQYKNSITKDLNLGSEPFKDSIADANLSTRWFLKRYFELTGISVTSVKELAELAQTNNTARQLFKEFALNMGDFLSNHLDQLNPEALLITGNIAKAATLFLPALKKQLKNRRIILAQLGEEAALIGAACMFVPENHILVN